MKCLPKYTHKITEVRIPVRHDPVRDWSSYREISHSTQDLRHEPGLELLMTHSKAQLLDNHLRELNHYQHERYMNQIEISRELDLRLRVPAVAAAWDHYQLMLKLAQ
jgi:hypothetical protein